MNASTPAAGPLALRSLPAAAQRTIEECAHAAHAATLTFPEILARLASAGVESYFADYRRGSTTYYLASGASHSVALPVPEHAAPEAFDAPAIVEAIRGSQRGEVKYLDFVRRTLASGCIGYFVWLAGRHVRYLGRRGEDHVERFPQSV